jgi:predicted TIM-barrel fold metal-dependent hydrolase
MPEAFIPVLDEHPRLKLVLAHLGGGAWRSIATVAERFEQVWFDLSEINAWTGAELAPTSAELAELIRTVGTHRVLAGSDFPWYEPADMVARVRALPGLDDAEVEAILGQNAQALLER